MANLSDKFSTYGLSLATAQVEYLLNSSSGTSGSDTSSFAYGAAGQSIVAFSSSGNWVTKRVQSIVAITPQDRITLEISQDGNEWTDAREILPAFESGSNKYGMRVIQVDSVSNQLDVQFGGNGATGTNLWSATLEGFTTALTTWKWRVRVTRGNLAAGFGMATATVAGLVSGGNVPGSTAGTAIATGYLGQVIYPTSTISNQSISTSYTDVTNGSLSLTAGVWQIYYSLSTTLSTAASPSVNDGGSIYIRVTDGSNNTIAGSMKGVFHRTVVAGQQTFFGSTISSSVIVTPSSTTTYKLRAILAINQGTITGTINVDADRDAQFFAVRIG